MKKIVFFNSSITLSGGTERVLIIIANKLVQLGYDVAIISFYGHEPFFEIDKKIEIIALFSKKKSFKLIFPYVLYRLRKAVTVLNPDVFIDADAALFMYSSLACIRVKLKHIVWEHFNFNVSNGARIRIMARKLAAKYADTIVTLTLKDQKNWQKNLNPKIPIIAINNPSPFAPQVNNTQFKDNIVLSVGRLTPQKGFDRLLDVWKIIQSKFYSDWQLHIVGSGELEGKIINKINELKISDTVKLFNSTPDIGRHYSNAKIYCMASRFEGFPMVLLEAQCFGLPLVSYDCETGPSEIIKKNGVLIKDGDAPAMADALINLMKNKKDMATMEQLSFENSFNYTTDSIIKQWIALL